MPIVSSSLTALAIAASVLAPVGAGIASSPASAEVSQSQAVSAAASITSVDWFKSRDKVVTGTAAPGTATVRISGLNLAPGAYREGAVAADGAFTVNLAPFASRAMPLSTLTATAVAADGTIGGSQDFVVEITAKPAAASNAASSSTLPGRSATVVTKLKVDPIKAGAESVTGVVPAGTQDVAVEVFGSTVFGEVHEDGTFTVELGEYSSYTQPGVMFEVWSTAADGSIAPSTYTAVTR